MTIEERPRPVNRTLKGVLARRLITAFVAKNFESLMEAIEDLIGGEYADSSSGQLDGQTQTVELVYQLSDSIFCFWSALKVGLHCTGSVKE